MGTTRPSTILFGYLIPVTCKYMHLHAWLLCVFYDAYARISPFLCMHIRLRDACMLDKVVHFINLLITISFIEVVWFTSIIHTPILGRALVVSITDFSDGGMNFLCAPLTYTTMQWFMSVLLCNWL